MLLLAVLAVFLVPWPAQAQEAAGEQAIPNPTITLDLGQVTRADALRAIREASAMRLVWDNATDGLSEYIEVRLRDVAALDALTTVLEGSPYVHRVLPSGFVGLVPRLTGRIAGRITDADTGDPLPGVAVLVLGTVLGDAAGPDGRFAIERVPEGRQTLEAQLIGYETAQQTVAVPPGETVNVEIELAVATVGLDGVTVVAETEASRIERSAQAVAVLDLVEERVQTADLGEVLARTEGVAVQRAGGLGSGTRVSLNGLSDDQVRFFFNGLPLGLAGYPFGIANIPVNLIERAEVYKGVVPIRFGADALG
ncbi:MAG: carboxypeptidase-like regulatory domain-containing protein, partial [Bacteroidota bacterium]